MPGNALKLEPWDTNSQNESFPQVPGASAGSWGRSTSPDSTARPATGLCGLECDEPITSRNRSPNPRQRMTLSNRDKESLLEEIIDLKRALADQAYHLKLHRVHYSAVQLENRKLEKDVEDLEVSGNLEAPRTGGPSRLRAKLQGLRTRLGDLQATCDLQHDELCLLRRDIRVAHTRECEVERDVYAAEIGRLQKVVKRLKALQLKIGNENRELSRLKDKAARLRLANQRLESCIMIAHRTLERAHTEASNFRAKALESVTEARKSAQKIKELQDQAVLLEELLENERGEKRKIQQKIKALAQKKKEWDKEWEAQQKKKEIAAAAEAMKIARKNYKKPVEPPKDRGAHATEGSSEGSLDSDDGRETELDKKRKREAFEARKKETLENLELQKISMMKKVKLASHSFIQAEHSHYDKLIAHSGAATSTSSLSPKDQQQQQDLETTLFEGLDRAALDFMDEVEEIHYGSKIPYPDFEGLTPKQVAEAKAKYAKDVAEDIEKRKKAQSDKGGGSRPGSPSSGASATSRPGTSDHDFSMESSSDDSGGGTGHSLGSDGQQVLKIRKDREGGKNGKKMMTEEFEEQKMTFLKKTRKASQVFIEEEQNLYGKIISEVESGVRRPGSVGWFTSTSSISGEDKELEQVYESNLHEGVGTAADALLDRLEDVQYGSGKVPRLKLQQMKEQEEARLAREREERMYEQAEMEERARKKAEREALQRLTSGQNQVDVMIDSAVLEEDEFSASLKEVQGRLSVEINLKRTEDHPYPGSPRALEEERRRQEQERLAKEAQEALYQAEYEKQIAAAKVEQEKEEQARLVAEEAERDLYRGLTANEDHRRKELEAKLASGIPLTLEEEAELQALRAKMRGKSGLTLSEEIRLKELEAKIAAGIPLTDEEEAEFKALKARFRGKSGLTAKEEARFKELQAKIAAGIPLTPEEEAEFKALKARLRGKSGLTLAEEARVRELQAKLKSGIPLTAEEEAELRDLMEEITRKSGLTGREETRLKDLEAKLKSGIPLTDEEEAELRELRSRLRGQSGLTAGQESRLMELEEKIRNGIPLTAKEEAELRELRAQMVCKSGLTGGEEKRLKELEAKIRNGIPLTAEEEAELKRLQKKLRLNSQITAEEDERRRELEAKLAAGIELTDEEERELKELQAKRWGEWPLSAAEEFRRKELEAKLRSGVPLTPEEEEELKALQAKLRLKFPLTQFGEADMARSEEMRKKGKLPFIDSEMQGFIRDNIRGVLGHLENITEVIVHKQEKLLKHKEVALAASGAAMDILDAPDVGEERPDSRKKKGDHDGGSKPGTPRGQEGGSRPGTPRGEKPHSPHGEKGEHSRLGPKGKHEDDPEES